jgi:hypothetical protein
MFQPMIVQQMQLIMGRNDMIMAEQREYKPFLTPDMYNSMTDIGCHGHMMVPMVKVERALG